MQEKSTQPANIVRDARYFPSTIEVIETGEVSKSCSVLSFLSSDSERIVKSGMRIISANIMIIK